MLRMSSTAESARGLRALSDGDQSTGEATTAGCAEPAMWFRAVKRGVVILVVGPSIAYLGYSTWWFSPDGPNGIS
jgi:hypothetical protein